MHDNKCNSRPLPPFWDPGSATVREYLDNLFLVVYFLQDITKEMKLCPKTDTTCASVCDSTVEDALQTGPNKSFSLSLHDDVKWIHVKTISEVYGIFQSMKDDVKYMLVAGHTSHGKI